MSRSHLSHSFKAETGMALSDFIMQKKLKKQKNFFITQLNLFLQSALIWDFPRKATFHVYSKNMLGKIPVFTEIN